ncbi:potassium channel family protein [Uliginosibacterium aquaticum]|uniref:Two pore domain potassium channel family protein n=1 Tax=Uliginosibacterium aquaticum TaxID=2731212 RepID=A0ABX2IQ61_9RHOO|nr:potassium channel family protein [Uliginosibacterium aquaticum]NSL56844.1 two pore domain potassium channel family protein [Uliginosibacterium aquaticum]
MFGKVLLIGLSLAVVIVLLHAIGSLAWGLHIQRKILLKTQNGGRLRFGQALNFLLQTASVMMLMMVVETVLWAFLYLLVDAENSFPDAIHFSLQSFTTVGFGDIMPKNDWRLLGGIEAINGVLIIGWTTAAFYAVVSQIMSHTQALKSRLPGQG